LQYPGVYLLAYTAAKLNNKPVAVRDVFYVGMSNSAGGVRQRLKQFKVGIENNTSHSGARRFFKDHNQNRAFTIANTGKRFYFVALTIECLSDKATASPDDLRQMGHVTCLEYYAIAHVAKQTGKRPALNKLGVVIE